MTDDEMEAVAEESVKQAFFCLHDVLERFPDCEFIPNYADGFLFGSAYGITKQHVNMLLDAHEITEEEAGIIHQKACLIVARQKAKIAANLRAENRHD